MRLLHINSTIVVNSGVMSVLMNYYRHIDREKVQFDFLYFSESKFMYKTYEKEINENGGQVFFVDNFKNIITFNRKLNVILKEKNYKTVHIHDPFVVNFIYHTLRKNGVENIIVHSHATKWSDKKLSGLRNKILCTGLKSRIDYAFACSKAAGEFLYKNHDFYVMNNAVDLERYAYNSAKRESLRNAFCIKDKLVFGHVGNMCAQKNHAFLLNVFKEIVRINPNSILILIGDGVLREMIEEKIVEYHLEKYVLVLGKKNDVENYYQIMDCMILPSLYEGLPMVGVEAQCAGVPVLFSDSITKEIGTDFSAYLSLEAPPEKWAKNALQLAENIIDRENCKIIMETKGFNIINEALKAQEKYLKMEKGK